eukprot:gb/GEZN01007642.1/.p1 GENE.gb/GEZN01007642.1/~~gb/GEZN01007642.1/.p1  ORF type:complete len:287 (-),score=39.79 gb/GEZN01007642.1/:249-1109(-)
MTAVSTALAASDRNEDVHSAAADTFGLLSHGGGHGLVWVIKPSLGQEGQWLAVLGLLYFVFEAVMELLLKYSQTHVVSKVLKAIFVIPPSLLDAVFYWWIFLSLARVIQSLRARRQTLKLELYWKFALVLLVSLLIAVGLALYQMYYFSNDMDLYDWKELWAMEVGYNELVAGSILCSILWLWRPTVNSQRYSYASVPTDMVELVPQAVAAPINNTESEPVRIDLADQKQILTTKKSKARFALVGDDDDEDEELEDVDAVQALPSSASKSPAIFSKGGISPNGKLR